MKRIYTCSSNPGKMAEFLLIAGDADLAGYEMAALPALGQISPPEETGITFEENAELKARYYSSFTDDIVLADDSGLEVRALGEAPGIYSARFAGEGASNDANNDLLLARMNGVADRRARFVCAIALARRGRTVSVVRGTVEGQLLEARSGNGGFGYDPLFFYPPLGCAFAELSAENKLAVSHRGNALRQIVKLLASA